MKKSTLFVFIISALLISVSPVLAAEELWSKGTSIYKVQRSGNSITLTSTNPPVRAAGVPSLVGTITGTTFTGKQHLLADGCPNLEGYVPANGTVSADGSSITVTFISSDFYTSSCTIRNEFEDSYTYTRVSVANTDPTPSSVAVPTGNDCLSEYHKSKGRCSDAYIACVDACPGAQGIDLSAQGACIRSCDSKQRSCNGAAKEAYDACVGSTSIPTTSAIDGQNGEKDQQSEKPQVGVSSNDFRALVRANAQYQKAQAELEEIKKANNPRYEAKKDFASEYNTAFKGNEQRKKDLDILRADLETVHELFSKTNDYIEIEETIESIKKGEIGEYGKMDLFTDAVNSFNTYHDLRAKGVSAKDATTKATLDNFGTSALTLIPVLKAIDLVATTPDFILETFGVGEDNWSRAYVTDGFIGKFAPSGVVEQTTELMIEDDWVDIGNALAYGWGKVQSADGVLDTTYEAGKLLAGTIGAVPVVIAQGVSDVIGSGIAIGEKAFDFVSSWFTYPN